MPENKNTGCPGRSQLHSSSNQQSVSSRPYLDIDTDKNNNVPDRHGSTATDRQLGAPSAPAYPHQHWDTPQDHATFPSTQSGTDESRTGCPKLDKEETIIHPQKVLFSNRNCPLRSRLIFLESSIGSIMVSEPIFAGSLSLTNAGPGSWVSICSQPGLRWVSGRVGNTDFAQSAKSLTLGWSRRLKLLSPRTRSEEPEPDEARAWKYCTGTHHPRCDMFPMLAS